MSPHIKIRHSNVFTFFIILFNFRKWTGGCTCRKPNTASSMNRDNSLHSTCSPSSGAAASWQRYEGQESHKNTLYLSTLSFILCIVSFSWAGGLCNKSYFLMGGLPTHSHGVSIDLYILLYITSSHKIFGLNLWGLSYYLIISKFDVRAQA